MHADVAMREQVTTKLKVGVMWDHNGTYMEGFGFQYRDQKVTIEIDESDELAGVCFQISSSRCSSCILASAVHACCCLCFCCHWCVQGCRGQLLAMCSAALLHANDALNLALMRQGMQRVM